MRGHRPADGRGHAVRDGVHPGHPHGPGVRAFRATGPAVCDLVGESMGMEFGLGGRVSDCWRRSPGAADGDPVPWNRRAGDPLLRRPLQPDFERDIATIKAILEGSIRLVEPLEV